MCLSRAVIKHCASDCRIVAACLLFSSMVSLHASDKGLANAQREAARLNNLGTAFMNQQMLERAEQKFADAYQLDPSLAIAKINQGLALLYLQRLPEAQKALDIAAQKAPNDPHTWYVLGLLYRNQNESQRSLEAFKKVVAIDSSDADARYYVASLLMELNDLPGAVAEYEKALKLNPLHASSEFGLARALQRQGKVDEARTGLERFQHITNAKLGSPLAHSYGEEGKYALAEDAAIANPKVEPMIPVVFTETWRSSASLTPTKVPAAEAGGTCIIDLSGDGEKDLVVMGHGDEAVSIYRNMGVAGFKALSEEQTGIHVRGNGVACAVGDYDNDGLSDLAFAMEDRILLFRNLGGGRFEEVTKEAGIEPRNMPTGLIFVDYDHDGDLDLLVTGVPVDGGNPNVLWRNNGNKTFTDWTRQAGLGGSGKTSSPMLADLNNDRAVDLLVAASGAAPTFFANRREGPFQSSTLFAGNLPSTVALATLDFNKDGWMDVVMTHNGAPGITLWRNIDGSRFERVPLPIDDAIGAKAVVPIDIDNDGWLDLAVLVQTATGPHLRVFRNLGPAGFSDVTAKLKLDALKLKDPRSLLAVDVDGDGAADLLITESDGSTIVLRNVGGSRNHSLRIRLKGMADNRTGIGTKVEVFANGLWQKWEETGQPEILAGLGNSDKADLVRLLWPTGVPQDELDLASDKTHLITELDRRGSSCPTLFAWNGSKYGFVTDVIGAGVVGHWISPTNRNIPDPDEWIKIQGSQLKEQNGRFSLRFGEPMEEVNFIDQVRLVAVDHPAATAVYPNERFLSEPPFAPEKTIATSDTHPLAGAWDDHGADVLSLLRERDHIYVKDFSNLPFAGFANKHVLTLDLGEWSADRPLLLLLHGFIEYFSASSMYAAWQAGLSPLPPSIEAKFPDGTWHKIIGDMGFPAGLPRTVVVDLTGKLPLDVTRIRISTNLQIYWDQALVENGPEIPGAGGVRQTEMPIASANLAFRGYPQQIEGKTPGDLTYDYQQISSTGPFVPHRGAYTRYGDVTPLLRTADDKFVVFGTGEDMDLEFDGSLLPALPQGWTRDYFFYANGFVKDMDFYEANPFLVGSLPFHRMSTYPYPGKEHFPDDAAHIAYQLEWNTRFEAGPAERKYKFHYLAHPTSPEFATPVPNRPAKVGTVPGSDSNDFRLVW